MGVSFVISPRPKAMCSTLSPTEKVGLCRGGLALDGLHGVGPGLGRKALARLPLALLLGAVSAALGVLLGYFVDEAAGQVHGGAAENHALARVGYVQLPSWRA